MIVLPILALVVLVIFIVGFVAGIWLFIKWVWDSVSNDNDYGRADHAGDTRR